MAITNYIVKKYLKMRSHKHGKAIRVNLHHWAQKAWVTLLMWTWELKKQAKRVGGRVWSFQSHFQTCSVLTGMTKEYVQDFTTVLTAGQWVMQQILRQFINKDNSGFSIPFQYILKVSTNKAEHCLQVFQNTSFILYIHGTAMPTVLSQNRKGDCLDPGDILSQHHKSLVALKSRKYDQQTAKLASYTSCSETEISNMP